LLLQSSFSLRLTCGEKGLCGDFLGHDLDEFLTPIDPSMVKFNERQNCCSRHECAAP
jgi:hypothetical protein